MISITGKQLSEQSSVFNLQEAELIFGWGEAAQKTDEVDSGI